jgi:hypothetical protein
MFCVYVLCLCFVFMFVFVSDEVLTILSITKTQNSKTKTQKQKVTLAIVFFQTRSCFNFIPISDPSNCVNRFFSSSSFCLFEKNLIKFVIHSHNFRFTTSPLHLFTSSSLHLIITSPHHYFTSSLLHLIITSQPHNLTCNNVFDFNFLLSLLAK